MRSSPGYDHYGKEIDREPSARVCRDNNRALVDEACSFGRSFEIIHNLCYRCFLASDE